AVAGAPGRSVPGAREAQPSARRTRARNVFRWDDGRGEAAARSRLRRDLAGHGGHRVPAGRGGGTGTHDGGRGARPHGSRYPPLRQATDDVVRARSSPPMAGRGRDGRGRGGRRANRQGDDTRRMDTVRRRERALLAALKLPKQRRFEVEESLDELGRLAESAGAEVVGRVTQERAAPTPKLYFGKGKVDELKTSSERQAANLVISDDSLSPIQ